MSAPSIEQLLLAMERWEASDLFVGENRVPAVRLHGGIVPLEVAATSSEQVARFAQALLDEQKSQRLATHGQVDVGLTVPATSKRYRISIARELGRLSLCARALPTEARSLEALGLPPTLGTLALRASGLLLIAGGPGAGKSTTLAALVATINARRPAHVLCIEDPIEVVHADQRARIAQREVGVDVASYEAALEQARRLQPDVVCLGALDSAECVRGALDAAARGQLVVACVGASNALGALSHLLSRLPEAERAQGAVDLALALAGVVAQKLVPRQDMPGRIVAVDYLEATPLVTELLRERQFPELEDRMRERDLDEAIPFDVSLEGLCRQALIAPEVALAYATYPELQNRRLRATYAVSQHLPKPRGVDVHELLSAMRKRGASDLHISVGRSPILRINGVLVTEGRPPLDAADLDATLRSLLSARQRMELSRDLELDFAMSFEGSRFRVNAYFEQGRPALAFRAIASKIPDPMALGLPASVLRMGDEPHGLLLVVGPTGAGKTTTLACLIDRINHSRPCHVLTVEDPIEYVHVSDKATIHQREVGDDTHDFASALKYILRQDPDVVLVGELRDLETISAALTAAETGHLVLATLHTNDAVQTIDRLIDVFPPHQQTQARSQLAAALIGVVSQRLLPTVDQRGRVAAFEVMVATPAIRTLIREAKMHQALGVMQTSRAAGMVTLDQSLEELLRRSAIDKAEALRYMQSAPAADKTRGKNAPP